MVQVRTPTLKQKICGTTTPLTKSQAFSGTSIARIGQIALMILELMRIYRKNTLGYNKRHNLFQWAELVNGSSPQTDKLGIQITFKLAISNSGFAPIKERYI